MDGAHRRLFKISELMQGDPEGNLLMEDVLNACFDYSSQEIFQQPDKNEDRSDQLNQLMVTLERFNLYVSERFSLFEEGLFKGSKNEVASWSEDLVCQILSNRPH